MYGREASIERLVRALDAPSGATSRIGRTTAILLLERLRVVLAAAALAALLPMAEAQTSANSLPALVSVTRCSIDTSYVASNPFYGPAQQSDGGNVRLAFENDNDVSAIGVSIIVTEGAYKQRVYVSGKFAHGVVIERTFKDSVATGNQNAKCTIAEVHFADGSSWSADLGNVAPR